MSQFSVAFERLSAALEHGTPRTWKSLNAPTDTDPDAVAALQLERKKYVHARFNDVPIIGRMSLRACVALPDANVLVDDLGQTGKWIISTQLSFKAPERLDITSGEYNNETHLIIMGEAPRDMDAIFTREQRAQDKQTRAGLSAEALAEIAMLEKMFGEIPSEPHVDIQGTEPDVCIARTVRNTLPGPIETTDGFKPCETHAGVIRTLQANPDISDGAAMVHTVTGESICPSPEWPRVVAAIDWLLDCRQ